MLYKIHLPKTVKGLELIEALGQTANKHGWIFNRDELSYSISPDSPKPIPDKFKLCIRADVLKDIFDDIYIIPDEEYSSLSLFTYVPWSKKNLEKFYLTLYDILK